MIGRGFDALFGGFKRKPSKKELAKVSEAHSAADPTTYSPLPLQESVDAGVEPEYSYPVVSEGGNQYVEIGHKDHGRAAVDMIVARLLKGIINVSDVVDGTGEAAERRYSKILPLDKIAEPTTQAEAAADFVFLAVMFADYDHFTGHNAVRNDKDKQAYYDFTQSFGIATPFNSEHAQGQIRYLSQDGLMHLSEKLKRFENQLQGPEGLAFISAILNGTDTSTISELYKLHGTSASQLQEILTEKARKTREVIEQRLAPVAQAA